MDLSCSVFSSKGLAVPTPTLLVLTLRLSLSLEIRKDPCRTSGKEAQGLGCTRHVRNS